VDAAAPAADFVLALARHAARLIRAVKVSPEFPLRVHCGRRANNGQATFYRPDKYEHSPVEIFLDEGPERALLVGVPGAGKSYALQQAAARLAERVHAECLSEQFAPDTIVIPTIADLKLYHGDLWNLVEKTLPVGLALEPLVRRFKVKIFLDSFNEMPREHWEGARYEADFINFIDRIGTASVVIASRTNDGLAKLAFPSYYLDEIDEGFVREHLQQLRLVVKGRFNLEIQSLLRKPFYFRLVTGGLVGVPEEAHPRDIYRSFFQQLSSDFSDRFGMSLDLTQALSSVGYEAINRGEEAQPLVLFLQVLGDHLHAANIRKIDSDSVTNWLVSKSGEIVKCCVWRVDQAAIFLDSSRTPFLN